MTNIFGLIRIEKMAERSFQDISRYNIVMPHVEADVGAEPSVEGVVDFNLGNRSCHS